MLKKIWSVTMMLMLLVYSMGDAWRLIWYQVDRDSFVERFCENIERPQLECQASCQLKQLTQNFRADADASVPADLLELKLPAPFLLSAAAFPGLPEAFMIAAHKNAYLFHYARIYCWAPFHPPS